MIHRFELLIVQLDKDTIDQVVKHVAGEMELLTDDGLKNEMRSLQRYLRYLVRKYQEVAAHA